MGSRIIAAVRNDNELDVAVKSKINIIFLLSSNIETLKSQVDLAHQYNKKIFVHIDLADGIGKDEYGIRFVKSQGADGIISTRSNLIKLANKESLYTVQRFFIVDTHSVDTMIESVKSSKPYMIEIMPGTVCKVVKKLKNEFDIPVVAGGLIETTSEIKDALLSGAVAISTGKKEFWENVK